CQQHNGVARAGRVAGGERGHAVLEGGQRVPRFHEEDRLQEILIGRVGHARAQAAASLKRERLRVSSSASCTRSPTVLRVCSTACSVLTATWAIELMARATPSTPRTCSPPACEM